MPLFACLGLFRLALRAASSLSSEHKRQTLDSLLTTDLSNEDILKGKWLGCVLKLKGLGLVLATYTLCGMLLGFIPLAGGLLLLIGCGVQASFVICLGMACSLASSSTFRATVATCVVLLAVTVGHWLLYLIGSAAFQLLGRPDLIHPLHVFHSYGLTPPVTLSTLATCSPGRLPAACLGTLLQAALAWGLWLWVQRRFRIVTGQCAESVRRLRVRLVYCSCGLNRNL